MTSNLAERLMAATKNQRRRIVVIGDAMVDRWIHGRLSWSQDGCSKFVQESVISVVETPGGAGNAAACLVGWPTNTSLYGYSESSDCPIKCRYVDDGKIVFRVDHDGPPRTGYNWAREMALEMIDRAGAVLLSDYDKGFLTPEFIRDVVTRCKQHDIPCVADCKRPPEVYAGCIRKFNSDYLLREFDSLVGVVEPFVVTQGSDGPMVHIDGVADRHIIANLPSVVCVNHVGAGDCFAAHLTLALAYEFSLKEAAAVAHSAGRVYVQHSHNRPPIPEEVAADMSAVYRDVTSTSTP